MCSYWLSSLFILVIICVHIGYPLCSFWLSSVFILDIIFVYIDYHLCSYWLSSVFILVIFIPTFPFPQSGFSAGNIWYFPWSFAVYGLWRDENFVQQTQKSTPGHEIGKWDSIKPPCLQVEVQYPPLRSNSCMSHIVRPTFSSTHCSSFELWLACPATPKSILGQTWQYGPLLHW